MCACVFLLLNVLLILQSMSKVKLPVSLSLNLCNVKVRLFIGDDHMTLTVYHVTISHLASTTIRYRKELLFQSDLSSEGPPPSS